MSKIKLGEIKRLEVGPEMSPQVVKKLARRHAMTGGFELFLKQELTQEDLVTMAESFLPEALKFSPTDLRFQSNNAFRVLKLLYESNRLPEAWKNRLTQQVFSH